jgi:hypothetical protein
MATAALMGLAIVRIDVCFASEKRSDHQRLRANVSVGRTISITPPPTGRLPTGAY